MITRTRQSITLVQVVGSLLLAATATMAVAAPNLTPYKPDGWSDKIVVSRSAGSTTDDTDLTPGDTLYVDWAVVNNGDGATSARFYTELYVDGTLKNSWYSDPPVNPNSSQSPINAYSIGTLSAGQHTLRIKADSGSAIAESNENDNEYSKTITVGQLVVTKATLTSPSPGSTLNSSSVTFSWSSGSGVAQYYLYVGTTRGGDNIYRQSAGLSRSLTVSGLPEDGSTVYVRLWSRFGADNWQSNDYTYTAFKATGTKAVLTSPTPGSTLSSQTVTFSWSSGSGVAQYYVYVGATRGGDNIYRQSAGLSRSLTVSGLPEDGSTVYVRLWSRFGADNWQSNDYTYTAFKATGTKAVLTDPAPGSTLSSWSVTFSWSSGSGVAQYYVYVGATRGGDNIYRQSAGLSRSLTVSGLPEDGSTVYVRLWSRFGADNWQSNDYTYTAQQTPARIVLLLHGMNSNPGDAWNYFVGKHFKSKVDIFGGYSPLLSPPPDAQGVFCYTVDFGAFDIGGKTGLEGLTASNATGDTAGDFSTFDALGIEVRDAIRFIANQHSDAEILLVAHSRGGLAARSFLQRTDSPAEQNRIKGVLTIGSPHQGSRLGRIWAYLKGIDKKTATGDGKQDWDVVTTIQQATRPLDIQRPVIGDLADNSKEIEALSASVGRMPKSPIYAQLLFTGTSIGYLLPDYKGRGPYSIFNGIFSFAKVSATARRAILEDQDPSAFPGDGIVTLTSQKLQNIPNVPDLTIKEKSGKNGVYHIDETLEEAAIFEELKVMVSWWDN